MTQHAIGNAAAWMQIIAEMLEALDAMDGDDDAYDAALDAINCAPLSVQVRDAWRLPGEKSYGADEYEILLSTGGPALRIYGRLNDHCEPDDFPSLQWQDWGTPWTDAPCDRVVLQRFAACFYFGE